MAQPTESIHRPVTTLEELFIALQELTDDDSLIVATVSRLSRSGRLRKAALETNLVQAA